MIPSLEPYCGKTTLTWLPTPKGAKSPQFLPTQPVSAAIQLVVTPSGWIVTRARCVFGSYSATVARRGCVCSRITRSTSIRTICARSWRSRPQLICPAL
jgi:hypothetical protein